MRFDPGGLFSRVSGSDSLLFDCVGVCGGVKHSEDSVGDKDDVDWDFAGISSFDEISLLSD